MNKSDAYPQYQGAKIPWLDAVPEHWDVMPLFSVASEIKVKNIGMVETNLLSLSYGQIVRRDINSNEGLLPESFETYQIVEAGDIVFRMTDLQNDQRSLRSALAQERGIITSAYIAVRPDQMNSKFLNYLMRAYDVQKVFYAMGGGLRQSLKFEDMRRLPLVIPSTSEQQFIVDYLERETARIDTLIAKKTRFIELLKEKRQAVITKAVTKGLDDSVEMKDSGVEWIGKVPSHWSVGFLKRFIVFQRGHDLPSDRRGDGHVPVISSGGVSGTHDVSVARAPGIVTGRYGSIGSFTFVEEDYWPLNTALYSVSMNDNNPRFLWYLLQSLSDLFLMNSLKSAVPGIDRNDIHEICTAAPPIEEQRAIAAYLDRECDRIDLLINKTERSIELLKEKRSALITAAVTGKIDVREPA